MGLENRYTVYPMAEMAHVKTESLAGSPVAVDVLSIPEGMIIEQVLVRVKTPAVDVDANNLIVGDEDDDNGFIVAADAKGAAGTVYGEDPTLRGAYLYDATKKGSFLKLYQEVKTLKLVLSAAPDTEGEYEVTVLGHRTVV